MEINPKLLAKMLRYICFLSFDSDDSDIAMFVEYYNMVQNIISGTYKLPVGHELNSQLLKMAKILNVPNRFVVLKIMRPRDEPALRRSTSELPGSRLSLGITISAVYKTSYLKAHSEKDLAESLAGLSLWVRKGDEAIIRLLEVGWLNGQIATELCKEEILLGVLSLANSVEQPEIQNIDYETHIGFYTFR